MKGRENRSIGSIKYTTAVVLALPARTDHTHRHEAGSSHCPGCDGGMQRGRRRHTHLLSGRRQGSQSPALESESWRSQSSQPPCSCPARDSSRSPRAPCAGPAPPTPCRARRGTQLSRSSSLSPGPAPAASPLAVAHGRDATLGAGVSGTAQRPAQPLPPPPEGQPPHSPGEAGGRPSSQQGTQGEPRTAAAARSAPRHRYCRHGPGLSAPLPAG